MSVRQFAVPIVLGLLASAGMWSIQSPAPTPAAADDLTPLPWMPPPSKQYVLAGIDIAEGVALQENLTLAYRASADAVAAVYCPEHRLPSPIIELGMEIEGWMGAWTGWVCESPFDHVPTDESLENLTQAGREARADVLQAMAAMQEWDRLQAAWDREFIYFVDSWSRGFEGQVAYATAHPEGKGPLAGYIEGFHFMKMLWQTRPEPIEPPCIGDYPDPMEVLARLEARWEALPIEVRESGTSLTSFLETRHLPTLRLAAEVGLASVMPALVYEVEAHLAGIEAYEEKPDIEEAYATFQAAMDGTISIFHARMVTGLIEYLIIVWPDLQGMERWAYPDSVIAMKSYVETPVDWGYAGCTG